MVDFFSTIKCSIHKRDLKEKKNQKHNLFSLMNNICVLGILAVLGKKSGAFSTFFLFDVFFSFSLTTPVQSHLSFALISKQFRHCVIYGWTFELRPRLTFSSLAPISFLPNESSFYCHLFSISLSLKIIFSVNVVFQMITLRNIKQGIVLEQV